MTILPTTVFQQRARVLRDQLPVEVLGLEWINRPQINVFERIFPLLGEKAAVDLTASVYGVSVDMLDPARIKRQQDAMLGDMSKGTAPTNAPEGLKTNERKKKSLADKEITELNKAQVKD